ncbi:MAG: GIY-YIG nuclease family protein [Candidatus Marinimicrobia bacterium]|jgi:hypothetical protein|nr:GIY-YIG nuclease family protein [Candidatus Neomarinimicrobiota bacterium]
MLDSFYVIPGYTFFYWGFTFPKKHYNDFIDYFDFKEGNLVENITIKIKNRKYDAKIRMARIDNTGKFESRSNRKYPERNVVQVFYDREYDTLKALRKLFIYSYASTIDKSKPQLKEVLEFIHIGDNNFRIKVVSQQKTDFDTMLRFMEDKNLFTFWKNEKSGKKQKNIFLDYSKKWLPSKDIRNYSNRSNVIYLLYHSAKKKLYIGKANILGNRVKKGSGRVGLDSEWDKFMFFEVHPDYSMFLEQIESFTIRTFASLLENDVGIKNLPDKGVKLVNRQLKKSK